MDDDFYMHLSSAKSKVFGSNTSNNFNIQLGCELSLKGRYSVSLTEIVMPSPKNKEIQAKYLTCNFVKPSIINQSAKPVLRVIYQNEEHIEFSPQYIPVSNNLLSILSFEVLDSKSNRIKFEDGDIELVLHFLKRW